MSALYTVDQTLQPKDYYSQVIKAVAFKNPLQALLKRGPKPEQWTQEVEVEGATKAFNLAAPEGGDFDETGLTARTNLSLTLQLQKFRSKRGYFVTRETKLLPGYTEKKGEKQLARQQRRDAEELMLSIERTLSSAQEAASRGTATDAVAKTRGLLSWLAKFTVAPDATAEQKAAAAAALHSVQTIAPDLLPTAGIVGDITSNAVFTEELFKAQLIIAARQSGDGVLQLTGLVGLNLKQIMSNWLGHAETISGMDTILRRNETKSRKIETICDEFAYDGVSVRTIVDNHLGCTMGSVGSELVAGDAQFYTGAFIRPEFWSIDTLAPLENYDLEDKGAGPRGYHEAIMRLACRNPLSQFAVIHDPSADDSSSSESSSSS